MLLSNDGELNVQVLGNCVPKDCDMGKVNVYEIAASIDSHSNILHFDYGIAISEIDLANYTMQLEIGTGLSHKLCIETFTIFKDNSERGSDYRHSIMGKKS